MNLFGLAKKSFLTVLSNPSVTLFFVLFLILSNFIASYAFLSKKILIVTLISICTILLTLSFMSGWFQVVKDISLDEEKKEKNYFPIFLEGIGKNIIPIAIGSVIYITLFSLVMFLTAKIASHFFGNLDFLIKDIVAISQNNDAAIEYFKNLPVDKQYTLYAWQLSFMLVGAIFSFVTFFFFPSIVFEKKGNIFQKPFFALFSQLKVLFKNFFSSLGLFFGIYLIYMILGILKTTTIFTTSPVLPLLFLFIYIYFICFVVMVVFNYYGKKYNSPNGPDCVKQEQLSDTISQDN